MENKEQQLIDLIFSMVLNATNDPEFCKRPRGERMAWVANALRIHGYDTHPLGMSWGVLVGREFREKVEVITKDLEYGKDKEHANR